MQARQARDLADSSRPRERLGGVLPHLSTKFVASCPCWVSPLTIKLSPSYPFPDHKLYIGKKFLGVHFHLHNYELFERALKLRISPLIKNSVQHDFLSELYLLYPFLTH